MLVRYYLLCDILYSLYNSYLQETRICILEPVVIGINIRLNNVNEFEF